MRFFSLVVVSPFLLFVLSRVISEWRECLAWRMSLPGIPRINHVVLFSYGLPTERSQTRSILRKVIMIWNLGIYFWTVLYLLISLLVWQTRRKKSSRFSNQEKRNKNALTRYIGRNIQSSCKSRRRIPLWIQSQTLANESQEWWADLPVDSSALQPISFVFLASEMKRINHFWAILGNF